MEIKFPHPRQADPHGLVYVGGDLKPQTLLTAYAQGIFPWPQPGYPLLWFSPPERGILDFSQLHLSRSLARRTRTHRYHFSLNKAFPQVIAECAKAPRVGQDGTWILTEMVDAYVKLHHAGYAHSVECWSGDELVGGLYGVLVRNVFSGESMFSKHDDSSKLCLLYLIEELARIGHTWMDIQMVTPVLENLGGRYIEREAYLERLQVAHQREGRTL